MKLSEKFRISVVGEGGELETFVFDGPVFKKKVEIMEASKTYKNYSGTYTIEKARLVEK